MRCGDKYNTNKKLLGFIPIVILSKRISMGSLTFRKSLLWRNSNSIHNNNDNNDETNDDNDIVIMTVIVIAIITMITILILITIIIIDSK